MARRIKRLTPLAVQRATRPGMYADGDGLYLRIGKAGTKSWVYRFMVTGRAREMGLGSASRFTLAEARQRVVPYRQQTADGIDPVDARQAERTQGRLTAARAITFRQAAERYIAAHRAGWANAKHAAQWTATLETYAFPTLGDLPVGAVETGDVTKALEPIWSTKPETAGRVRGRMEAILDYAKMHGWRSTAENPARWKGHLDHVLPARSKVRTVKHHAALPWGEIGSFMQALRQQPGIGAKALEFAILTAARTGEVVDARWDEIDMKAGVWIVPPERMKAGREHRVPLSPPAMILLAEMAKVRLSTDPAAAVFPGAKAGRGLSNMALLAPLRRMNRGDLTAHGFRSTFRDWIGEATNVPREVAEMALAHAVGDKTEQAYQRGDLFQKRRRLMDDWAVFCDRTAPGRQRGDDGAARERVNAHITSTNSVVVSV
jgi:integrase